MEILQIISIFLFLEMVFLEIVFTVSKHWSIYIARQTYGAATSLILAVTLEMNSNSERTLQHVSIL